MAEGIKIAVIVLVVGIVIAIIVVVIKSSSRKAEVAKCEARKKQSAESSKQNVQEKAGENVQDKGKPTENCSKAGSAGVKASVIVMVILILAVVGLAIYIGVTVSKTGNLCDSETVAKAEAELKKSMTAQREKLQAARNANQTQPVGQRSLKFSRPRFQRGTTPTSSRP